MKEELIDLRDRLLSAASIHEKLEILDRLPIVQKFLQKLKPLSHFLDVLAPECALAVKQLIAIGQADRLFQGWVDSGLRTQLLRDLIEKLLPIDLFYREIGGIVGYQIKILNLLEDSFKDKDPQQIGNPSGFHSPKFQDISEESEGVQKTIAWGIESLPEIAEMYPLGGAADRLHLVDEKTGIELPAAKLCFAGKTLLENLIRDLQAREYLYFKTYGRQVITPVAIMTSHEKENHFHVERICEEANWFGRPKESFRFFTQPLVPVVNKQGEWCVSGLLKPLLKPGGHGAIWKLARDAGIFDWFKAQGRKKVLIRQINNPIAGLDYGLLSFMGYGWKKEMLFGFASCPRLLKAAEGVNVVIESKREQGVGLVLTNIEYCDFTKFGIQDAPLKEGEPFSRFSSNTNILFADLKAVVQAIDFCPFPGLLINLKKTSYATESGEKKEEPVARLESTMQNLADVFVEEKPYGSPPCTERTFVTYNHRHKTISTAKKAFVSEQSIQETPENCFYDLLLAHRELLEKNCGVALPAKRTVEEYLKKGPEFLFLYHPALGPLYSSICKKIAGGKWELGSEFLLEIADFQAKNLHLEGSFSIRAERLMGAVDSKGVLQYSSLVGRCLLENVTVCNRGVDWKCSRPFWKMELQREESVEVHLKGRSLFTAKDVQFKGSHKFVVEEGRELRVSQKNGKIHIEEFSYS